MDKKLKTKKKAIVPETIMFNSRHDKYWYLSSFAPSLVFINSIESGVTKKHWFPNIEVGFQYFKTTSSVFREKIMQCTSPSKARYFGSAKAQCPIRSNWDDSLSKVVMRQLDLAKFSQNAVLAEELIGTGDATLMEFAPWEANTPYWGVNADGEGPNRKGKILMQVRQRLIDRKANGVFKGIATLDFDKL